MKRRDFIKLPVLIPGLKKLLDDFTLPDEKFTPDNMPQTFDPKDNYPAQNFLGESLKYYDHVSCSFSLLPGGHAMSNCKYCGSIIDSGSKCINCGATNG